MDYTGKEKIWDWRDGLAVRSVYCLSEDWNSFPNTHKGQLMASYDLALKNPKPSPGFLDNCTYVFACMCAHTHSGTYTTHTQDSSSLYFNEAGLFVNKTFGQVSITVTKYLEA